MDEAEFDRALEAGIAFEQRLDWEGALRHYDALWFRLAAGGGRDAAWHAQRASVAMRRANSLMVLRRLEDAREVFDEALHQAKLARDDLVLARAVLAAGVFAGSSGDTARAEGFLADALGRFSRIPTNEGAQGAGWALLNLGSLYARTGRLDLAFVILEKARERLFEISNWVGVAAAWEAQAQARRSIGDEDRWRDDLAEAVVFYDRQGMAEKAGELRRILRGPRVSMER